MTLSLGINTGFAVNRYAEPSEWVRIVGQELGLKQIQMTADLLNPDLPASYINSQIKSIVKLCAAHGTAVTSTFTGAFTRVNHLAHPDPDVRQHWIAWFKRFVDLSVDVGASNMGSHFGIFTLKDDQDPARRAERRQQNIDGWHEIGRYAQQKGLSYLSWEPMSISREQGETLVAARRLQQDVNRGAPIPFLVCLDVDHGDVTSKNSDDTDPYAWLRAFAADAPIIHIKQSSDDKAGHWPFIEKYNRIGRIRPGEKVVETLQHAAPQRDSCLMFEFGFREREPTDSHVIEVLKESVAYWRPHIPN